MAVYIAKSISTLSKESKFIGYFRLTYNYEIWQLISTVPTSPGKKLKIIHLWLNAKKKYSKAIIIYSKKTRI